MKKILLFLGFVLSVLSANAQLTYKNIVVGASTSANGRAPQTSQRHTRSVYYIPASELAAGGIDFGTELKAIGFNYSVFTATATGNLAIYLQNTTDEGYNKGTSWSTAISTMTKVSDGTVTIPAAATADFVFQNGSTFTYNGGGLYVAFEYTNAGTLGAANTALCNNALVNGANGLASSSSTTSITGASNTLSSSNFRPYTRLAYQQPNNDVGVPNVYAMSTAPVNEGLQKIAARVKNYGLTVQGSIDVTLTVSGANTFTSTKNIASLASDASQTVTFDDFVPTTTGTNNISVSIAVSDDNSSNNTTQVTQEVVAGRYSHNVGTAATGSFGFADGEGLFAVRNFANGTVFPKGVKIRVGTSTTGTTRPIQAVLLNSAGVTLASSAVYNVTNDDNGTFLILNFETTTTSFTNEEFYVGIALQGSEAFYPVSGQTESPIRPGTFYSASTFNPDGVTTLGGTTTKFMIEALTTNAVLNANNTSVTVVHALGKNVLTYGASEVISTIIKNDGETIMENIPVALAISGANVFNNNKVIAKLRAGESATVNFDGFTASATGATVIAVTPNNEVPKTVTYNQVVTNGIFSHANDAPRASNIGSNSGDIMLLARYKMTGSRKVKAVRVTIGNNAANPGKTVYAVLTDVAGNVLAQSDNYVIDNADLGQEKDFILQTATTLTNQDFMVGLAMTGSVSFFPIGAQNESPTRANAFYTRSINPTFTLNNSTSSRYMISAITEDEVLPVTISTFTAKLNNNKVTLNWAVGTETNVNRYEVERSNNGTDFIKVAEVTANGSSNYSSVDDNPQLGFNYYRLKGVDNDGALSPFKELRTVKVLSLAAKLASVYPNPLFGNTINISLSGHLKGTYTYKLADVSGKLIQQGSFVNSGSESSAIIVNSTLPKGVYLLQTTLGSEVIQSKLIKQ